MPELPENPHYEGFGFETSFDGILAQDSCTGRFPASKVYSPLIYFEAKM